MRLSGTIETFLVFLPRRRANHRETGRFVRRCLQLVTYRLWIFYTRCVHMCAPMHKRKGREIERIERRRNRNADNYRSTPSSYRTQRCIAKFMSSRVSFEFKGYFTKRVPQTLNSLLSDEIKKTYIINYFSCLFNNLIYIKINIVLFLKTDRLIKLFELIT